MYILMFWGWYHTWYLTCLSLRARMFYTDQIETLARNGVRHAAGRGWFRRSGLWCLASVWRLSRCAWGWWLGRPRTLTSKSLMDVKLLDSILRQWEWICWPASRNCQDTRLSCSNFDVVPFSPWCPLVDWRKRKFWVSDWYSGVRCFWPASSIFKTRVCHERFWCCPFPSYLLVDEFGRLAPKDDIWFLW